MADDARTLITGGTGFLGSYLAYRLAARGERPLVLARSRRGLSAQERVGRRLGIIERALGKKVDPAQVEVMEGDITLPGLGLADNPAVGPTVGPADCPHEKNMSQVKQVIHTAALLSFLEKDKDALDRCNVEGTRAVIDFCLERSAELMHISTAFVCGIREGIAAEEFQVDPPPFRNHYERSKWEGESLVLRSVAEQGLKACVLRPSIILGDRARGFTSSFLTHYRWFHAVELLCRKGSRKVDIRFPADPEGVMNLVPVDYVADAILAIRDGEALDGPIYHLVSSDMPDNRHCLALVLEALQAKGVVLVPPADLPEAMRTAREQRIVNAVSEYQPYLDCRTLFDDKNTRAVMNGASPVIDQAYMNRIMDYARETDWGRLDPRIEPEGETSEVQGARRFFTDHLASFVDQKILPDLKKLDALFKVILTEPACGEFMVEVKEAKVLRVQEADPTDPEFSFYVPVTVFRKIAAGKEDPREAFFSGKTDIKGNLEQALAIIPVLKRFFLEYPYEDVD